ncbi:MAG: hypothetical protein JW797_08780 [Bradymonadales bacterium]|nr:hypothetical protein [Bradymonadales bacterium]
MKTTIEIADSLLKRAKKLAARERTTIRALVEESLQRVLTERERRSGFKLKKVTFRGEGLNPELVGKPWAVTRDLIYEGRGS